MRIQNKLALISGASLLTVISSTMSFAQSALVTSTANDQVSSVSPPDEIVVTATRRNESLQNVPMSVDVVTGSQLKSLNLFDAKDIQQLSPGLQLTNTSGRNNVATLRGVTFDPDSGAPPAVDIYYNEVPVDAQTIFSALYDVEQIEVLRGPQGSLRGRTAPAGAITIASKKPSLTETEGYIQGTGSDRGAYNFQGGVSIPIIEDKLAFRAAMLMDGNRLNQVYDITRGERSRSRTESARLSLAWKPADNLRIDVSYQYLESDDRQFQQVVGAGSAPAQFDPTRSGPPATVSDYIAVTDGRQRFQNRTHLLTALAAWDLGSHKLSLVGGYQNSRLRQVQDTDRGNAVPGYDQRQFVDTTYPVVTAEARLDSQFSGFWNYSLAAFYSRQTGRTMVSAVNNLFFDNLPNAAGAYLPLNVDIFIPNDIRTLSVASSSRFQFTDKLKLEVAARYSWYRNKFSAFQSSSSSDPTLVSPPTQTVLPGNQRLTPKALTGSANLTYIFSPAATGYISYGRSFRPAAVDTAIPAVLDNSLLVAKNETSNSIEAGIKTSFLNRRISVNADIFYQKFNNYIGRTLDSIYYISNDGQTGFANFTFNGDAEVKGAEATVIGRVNDNLTLSISASYTKARYQNALTPCNDYNGDGVPDANGTPVVTGSRNISFCRRNDRLADVPDFTLTSNGEYHGNVGDFQPFVRYLVTYTPSVYSLQANFRYPDRVNLNLYAGVRGPGSKWELTGFVKNVLNQQRITNRSLGTAQIGTFASPYDSGYYLINATVPREFGATLQFNF